jgi:hypothetical protein
MLPLVEVANVTGYEFAASDCWIMIYPAEKLSKEEVIQTLKNSLEKRKIKELKVQFHFPFNRSNFLLLCWA